MTGGQNCAQGRRCLDWKAARLPEWQPCRLSVTLVITPQVARLLLRHRHHVEASAAEQRGEMRRHPVHARAVAAANLRQQERSEVAVGAGEIEIEIDGSHLPAGLIVART